MPARDAAGGPRSSGAIHALAMMRVIMLKAVEDVQQGRDPKHVLRDPVHNVMVYIRGSEELEHV